MGASRPLTPNPLSPEGGEGNKTIPPRRGAKLKPLQAARLMILLNVAPEFRGGTASEDAGAARVVVVVDDDQRVAVEANVAAVLAGGWATFRADHDTLESTSPGFTFPRPAAPS